MNCAEKFFGAFAMVVVMVFFLTSEGRAQGPVLELTGGGCYFSHETLELSVSTTPGNEDNVGDLYFVLFTPGGELYSFGRWNEPNVLEPIIPSWNVIPLDAVPLQVPLSPLPTSTVGLYTFFLGMMEPGTLNLTSNLAQMSFYIKEANNVPAACQCPDNQWTFHTETFYVTQDVRGEVEISLNGAFPLTLTGDSLTGTVDGAGTTAYRNRIIAEGCTIDVGADWQTVIEGDYRAQMFFLTTSLTPSAVTGTITCSGVSLPFPPFTPEAAAGEDSRSVAIPMIAGEEVCSSINVSGLTGDTCVSLTCR